MNAIIVLALALGVGSAVGQGDAHAGRELCSPLQQCGDSMVEGNFRAYLQSCPLRGSVTPGRCLRRSFLAISNLDPSTAGPRYNNPVVDAHAPGGVLGSLPRGCSRPASEGDDSPVFRVKCQLELAPENSGFVFGLNGAAPGCTCVDRNGTPAACPSLVDNGTPAATVAPQQVVNALNAVVGRLRQPVGDFAENRRFIETQLLNIRRLCSDIAVSADVRAARRDINVPDTRRAISARLQNMLVQPAVSPARATPANRVAVPAAR